MTASFITPPTLIKYADNCSYQIVFNAGGSIGTFSVQASNDYAISEPSNLVTNAGDWVDLSLGGGVPFSAGTADDIIIDLNQLPFNAIRLSYTSATPGTSVCNVYLITKQVGG